MKFKLHAYIHLRLYYNYLEGFLEQPLAVLTKEGWVVIDALSTPSLSKEFADNLWRVKKAPIKYAIITHYHPGHWYGAKTYKQLGSKIIAHYKLLEEYNSGEAVISLEGAKQRFKGLFDDVELTTRYSGKGLYGAKGWK